jgi:hypothetical protein
LATCLACATERAVGAGHVACTWRWSELMPARRHGLSASSNIYLSGGRPPARKPVDESIQQRAIQNSKSRSCPAQVGGPGPSVAKWPIRCFKDSPSPRLWRQIR